MVEGWIIIRGGDVGRRKGGKLTKKERMCQHLSPLRVWIVFLTFGNSQLLVFQLFGFLKDEALIRLELRRQLALKEKELLNTQSAVAMLRDERIDIEEDRGDGSLAAAKSFAARLIDSLNRQEKRLESKAESKKIISSTGSTVRREYEWRIEDMSWLVESLEYDKTQAIASPFVKVGDSAFKFLYDPGGNRGSLKIRHLFVGQQGIIFRYKIFIKSSRGNWEQWGETGTVCKPHNDNLAQTLDPPIAQLLVGPDVPQDGNVSYSTKTGVVGHWCSSKFPKLIDR